MLLACSEYYVLFLFRSVPTVIRQQTADFPIVPMQIVLNGLVHRLDHLNDAFTYSLDSLI
jgi:hypothetical protein